jgi:hypothetical protein
VSGSDSPAGDRPPSYADIDLDDLDDLGAGDGTGDDADAEAGAMSVDREGREGREDLEDREGREGREDLEGREGREDRELREFREFREFRELREDTRLGSEGRQRGAGGHSAGVEPRSVSAINDIFLYVFSGLLLLFLIEQAIQLGAAIGAARAASVARADIVPDCFHVFR